MTQGDAKFAKALEPAIAIAPMNRMGTAQEVADACLFLCSSKASFVQGHAMVSISLHFILAHVNLWYLGRWWWVYNQLIWSY